MYPPYILFLCRTSNIIVILFINKTLSFFSIICLWSYYMYDMVFLTKHYISNWFTFSKYHAIQTVQYWYSAEYAVSGPPASINPERVCGAQWLTGTKMITTNVNQRKNGVVGGGGGGNLQKLNYSESVFYRSAFTANTYIYSYIRRTVSGGVWHTTYTRSVTTPPPRRICVTSRA